MELLYRKQNIGLWSVISNDQNGQNHFLDLLGLALPANTSVLHVRNYTNDHLSIRTYIMFLLSCQYILGLV